MFYQISGLQAVLVHVHTADGRTAARTKILNLDFFVEHTKTFLTLWSKIKIFNIDFSRYIV